MSLILVRIETNIRADAAPLGTRTANFRSRKDRGDRAKSAGISQTRTNCDPCGPTRKVYTEKQGPDNKSEPNPF